MHTSICTVVIFYPILDYSYRTAPLTAPLSHPPDSSIQSSNYDYYPYPCPVQWEQYFTGPLYRKRLFDVVEPSQFETPLLSLDALKSRHTPPSPSGSDANAPTPPSAIASKGKS